MDNDKTLRDFSIKKSGDSESETLIESVVDKEESPTLLEEEVSSSHISSDSIWYKGQIIDELYRVEDIAKGGMGIIYFVDHLKWGIKLVVKTPLQEFSTGEQKRRFIREAETWVDLGKHPNIATAFYVRELKGIPGIFIEYADGGSLTDWLKEKRDLPELLDMAIQFCEGMIYAHKKGLVHRDIKPDNVLLMKNGTLKITDFGLVKTRKQAGEEITDCPSSITPQEWHTITEAGAMGTPPYMPPEQWSQAEKADARSDIYSFGVMLFEMICNRRPFVKGPDNPQPAFLAYQIMHRLHPPPDPATFRDIPVKLKDLILKCLEKEPEKRYGSFEETKTSLLLIYREVKGHNYERQCPGEAELKAEDLNNRALSYLDLGKKEEARSLLEESIKLDPLSISAGINLLLLLTEEKWDSYENIFFRYKTIREANSGNPLPYYYEAIFELEQGDHRRALSLITEAVKISPHNSMFREFEKVILNIPECKTLGGTGGKITGVDFLSEDIAISCSSDSVLEMWDLEEGNCVKKIFEDETYMKFECFGLAVSPFKNYILSGHSDNTARLWNHQSGGFIMVFNHRGAVRSVDFSLDGNFIATFGTDGMVNIWNYSGECLKRISPGKVSVYCVRFSPDGKYIATVTGKNVAIWDIDKEVLEKKLSGHTSSVLTVCFSSDGKYIISGSEDNTLILWDRLTGKSLKTFKGHTSSVECVHFYGSLIVSGSSDGVVKVWDIEACECIRTIFAHKLPVTDVRFSPGGDRLISASKDRTLFYMILPVNLDKSTYKKEYLIVKPRTVEESFKDAENFSKLLSEGEKYLKESKWEEAHNIYRCALDLPGYTKDTRALEGIQRAGEDGIRENIKSIWLLKTFFCPEGVKTFDLSHEGLLVYGGKDITVRNMKDEVIKSFSDHVSRVKISKDGNYILFAGEDKILKLWDVKSEEWRSFPETMDFNTIALFPDASYIATGGNLKDTSIKIWNRDSGECIRTFRGHASSIETITLSEDGRLLLSGSSDNTLKIWESESGKCVATFFGHNLPVTDSDITSDGKFALSSSKDKKIKIWDLRKGNCLDTLEGSEKAVTSVAFSPEGSFIISGEVDGTLRLWSRKNSECLRVLKQHKGEITNLKFSSNGRYVFSGSMDGTIRIWEIDWQWKFAGEKISSVQTEDKEMPIIEKPLIIEKVEEIIPDSTEFLIVKDHTERKRNIKNIILLAFLGLIILIFSAIPLWINSAKKQIARNISFTLYNDFFVLMREFDVNNWDSNAQKMVDLGKPAIDVIVEETIHGSIKGKENIPVSKNVIQLNSLLLLEKFEKEKKYRDYTKSRATKELIRFLGSEIPVIRGKSAVLLGRFQVKESLPALKKALEEEDRRWSKEIIDYLESDMGKFKIPVASRPGPEGSGGVSYEVYYECSACHGIFKINPEGICAEAKIKPWVWTKRQMEKAIKANK